MQQSHVGNEVMSITTNDSAFSRIESTRAPQRGILIVIAAIERPPQPISENSIAPPSMASCIPSMASCIRARMTPILRRLSVWSMATINHPSICDEQTAEIKSNTLTGLLSWSRTSVPSWYHKGTGVLSRRSARELISKRISGRSPRFGPRIFGYFQIEIPVCAMTTQPFLKHFLHYQSPPYSHPYDGRHRRKRSHPTTPHVHPCPCHRSAHIPPKLRQQYQDY